jgi:putative phosphoribosyl transferase
MRTDQLETRQVSIPAGGVELSADVIVPRPGRPVVAFAHGAGSSRLSPRNRYVAGELAGAGLGTVLADLLTPDEERADADTGRLRFDIDLLSARMVALVDWLGSPASAVPAPRIGLFGASTGAAAALVAAATRPDAVATVVSRGGRPDLAGADLARVPQPTLLIVGALDTEVIELNQAALERLPGKGRLAVVPGATHLFEEPGALEQVAVLARDWFSEQLMR